MYDMSDQERIAALEAKLEELTKLTQAMKYQKGQEIKVLEMARAYGRMKSFGITINEPGFTTSYCASDIPDQIKYLETRLLDEAKRLIIEDSIVGSEKLVDC